MGKLEPKRMNWNIREWIELHIHLSQLLSKPSSWMVQMAYSRAGWLITEIHLSPALDPVRTSGWGFKICGQGCCLPAEWLSRFTTMWMNPTAPDRSECKCVGYYIFILKSYVNVSYSILTENQRREFWNHARSLLLVNSLSPFLWHLNPA